MALSRTMALTFVATVSIAFAACSSIGDETGADPY
jgi:hypothetical protein